MKRSIYGGVKILPSARHNILNGNWAVDPYIGRLRELAVTDWEQVHSLLDNPGTKALFKEELKISDTEEEYLTNAAKEAIASKNFVVPLDVEGLLLPLGAREPSENVQLTRESFLSGKSTVSNLHSLKKLSALAAFSASATLTLASSVNYISQLPPAKTQGDRGSCVAFAVTAINEFSFFKKNGLYTDLSEQYLFNETKQLENDSDCSSHIAMALRVLADLGQCPESVWSYNPNPPCLQPDGKPSNADQYALPFRNGCVPYNQAADIIQQIKSSLTVGQLVAFSIPVFRSWYNSSDVIRTGRITMPLGNEPVMLDNNNNNAGHAMAIVGYQDAVDHPGGGYFIIRNSWGPQLWGKQNVYGPGYGIIPYEYISNYRWEIYAI